MPIIDERSSAYNENSTTSWNAQLQNTKILLYNYDRAILALTQAGGVQSYQLDTGQSSQRVTRQDLSQLMEVRNILMQQIKDLELMLGIRPSVKQIVPAW